MFSVVPGGASLRSDSAGAAVSMPNYDREQRWGLNERADLGVRVNAGSGLIVTHERRLGPSLAESGSASALGLCQNDLMIVPSINVHGAGIGRLLGW